MKIAKSTAKESHASGKTAFELVELAGTRSNEIRMTGRRCGLSSFRTTSREVIQGPTNFNIIDEGCLFATKQCSRGACYYLIAFTRWSRPSTIIPNVNSLDLSIKPTTMPGMIQLTIDHPPKLLHIKRDSFVTQLAT
eukprot:scaffold1400_cov137-Cylindrotheca_fusiformis.AAC.18